MRLASLAAFLCITLIAGCTASGASAPSPTPVPPSPTPTAAPDFTIAVVPPELPTAIRNAIPGSKYAFLVTLEESGKAAGPVTVTATATKAKVVSIEPAALMAGTVGEVWVVADPASEETSGTVTITATRSGITKSVTRTLPVFPMKDERAADATAYFKLWTTWLAANHPELGITSSTSWEPVFVSTLLVVSHYSYWSKDWEMTIAWHNMIPPYDWTDVFLRHRGSETSPSIAYRMDSVSGKTTPHEVEAPKDVVR